MKLLATIAENWFNLLQSIGIIGSLLLGATSFRDHTKARRAETLLKITSEHRKLWDDFGHNPRLTRVRDKSVDLDRNPITAAERRFVQLVVLHLNAVFQACNLGALTEPEGLQEDVRMFFSSPIPAAVYSEQKRLLDKAFVRYIEDASA